MGKKAWLGLMVGAAIGSAPGVSASADAARTRPARPHAARRHHQPLWTESGPAATAQGAAKASSGDAATKARLQTTIVAADAYAGFKATLQASRFAEAMANSGCGWTCTSNSPLVDGAALARRPVRSPLVRRYQARQLTATSVAVPAPVTVKAAGPQAGLTSGAQSARFAEAEKLAVNSPILGGAAIAAGRPTLGPSVRRYEGRQSIAMDTNFGGLSSSNPGVALVANGQGTRVLPRLQATRFAEAEKLAANSPVVGGAVIDRDLQPQASASRLSLSEVRFGEAQQLSSNSPIVDGASMIASPLVPPMATRH